MRRAAKSFRRPLFCVILSLAFFLGILYLIDNPKKDGEGRAQRMKHNMRMILLRALLLAAAAALIVFGLMNGEFQKVLQKAAAICLECIGIG